MRLLILLLLLGGVYFFVSQERGFEGLPGNRLAPEQPVQKALKFPETIRKGEFSIALTHSFNLKALVLSSKSYGLGDEGKISPVDLALGWGPMSNPNPLRMIRISQSGRYYKFRYDHAPPIQHRQIELNSANMHMIPANDDVLKSLKAVRKGDVVSIQGYLVRVSKSDGWHWNSSTTRSDKGHGACELVYVEDIQTRKY